MLSHLDRTLFPDRCEVIEIIPSQRYIYSIFKNGHSSFSSYQIKNKPRIFVNQQIKKIKSIDVVLRNPHDRLLSGINTYIQHTLRDNPNLDPITVSWFARTYLYLDRHYSTQFSWLLNLARYTDVDTRLNFLPMSAVGDITGLNEKPTGVVDAPAELVKQVLEIKNNEMYQRIDSVVFGYVGQSLTFKELIQHIQILDPEAYEYVIGYAQQILNIIYVLPKT